MDEYRQVNGVCAAVSIDPCDRQWPLLNNVVMDARQKKDGLKSWLIFSGDLQQANSLA